MRGKKETVPSKASFICCRYSKISINFKLLSTSTVTDLIENALLKDFGFLQAAFSFFLFT